MSTTDPKPRAPLAFLDTETTGLDPDRHEIWEVGLILRTDDGAESQYEWQLPVDLSRADPIALNIGRFHERRWPHDGLNGGGTHGDPPGEDKARIIVGTGDMPRWAERFVELTRSAHLVGNVVSFDADRLWRLLRRLGQCPMWHYHLIDVEALAAGYLLGQADMDETGRLYDSFRERAIPPWDSERLSSALGVTVSEDERHTALGDARWARDLYDSVTKES